MTLEERREWQEKEVREWDLWVRAAAIEFYRLYEALEKEKKEKKNE